MPATVRVSDLAREVAMEPADLLIALREDFGQRVRNVSASIPESDARRIRTRLRLQRRRAARMDRRESAAEKIRRNEAERRRAAVARREAEEKEKEEAARREREAAAQRAEEAAREEREAEARKVVEEEERQAAAREAEAKRLAEAEQQDKSRKRAEAEKQRTEARRKQEETERAARETAAAPREDSGKPSGKGREREAAPPRQQPQKGVRKEPETRTAEEAADASVRAGRRLETRSIAASAASGAFRPGATERVITAPLTRPPARRATPPRIRATPPSIRPARPSMPSKPGRPGPGKRSRSRRHQAGVEPGEVTVEGIDNPLPPGLRQATREYRTSARIKLGDTITVKGLADEMSIPAVEVIKGLLLKHGLPASINQLLERDMAAKVLRSFGGSVADAADTAPVREPEKQEVPTEGLVERAPVITVMGHVDHGKTSLLDAIREARVADTEAGGITQHMSAYVVQSDGHPIVFLDTPGHEAFSKMRARGANVTDVVILVVAADDGVKEQTLEALNHARAAKVPIVVAVNKMDRPGADPDMVVRQLAERGVTPEDWGGDTIFCQVSAKTGEGLDVLLQSVLAVAELEEPMANPAGLAHGVVLEARKDRGRGSVAQLLVQGGSLSVGDVVSAGSAWGKVRALLDESGRKLRKAPPSTPVEVLGLNEVPGVGDRFRVTARPAEARQVAEREQEVDRLQRIEGRQRLNLASLHAQLSGEGRKELPIVVKADVGGTVEAVRDALMKLGNEEVSVQVVHAAAGAVTESDVNLAAAADAIVVAFGVRPDPSAARLAEREGVEIRAHTVIYHLTEEIEKAITGMLKPETEVVEVGKIEVRRTFQVPRVGVVAGSYVLEGAVPRSARVRLVRDGRVVHEGRIGSLRRFKDDVGRVREGFECGVGLAGYNDVKIGDIIEAFEEVPVENRAAG